MSNPTDEYEKQQLEISKMISELLVETSAEWSFPQAKDERSAIYGANLALSAMKLTPVSLFTHERCHVSFAIYESYEIGSSLEGLILTAIETCGEDEVRKFLLPEMKRLVALLEERTTRCRPNSRAGA